MDIYIYIYIYTNSTQGIHGVYIYIYIYTLLEVRSNGDAQNEAHRIPHNIQTNKKRFGTIPTCTDLSHSGKNGAQRLKLCGLRCFFFLSKNPHQNVCSLFVAGVKVRYTSLPVAPFLARLRLHTFCDHPRIALRYYLTAV